MTAMVIVCSTQATSAAGPSLEAKWRVATPATAPGTSELALTVTVENGWHVNANDPDRPYVIPTTLEIEAPAGTTIESIRYPDPVVRSLGFAPGTPLRLYEGTFTIGVRVAGAPPARFDAKLGYQACNDETCLPPRTLPVPFEAKAGGGAK
jgi:DsbC/DsbD-like thiol-disulfide interchange protein